MKRLFRNSLALLVCAALAALALSGLLLSCHRCEGPHCPVCLAVFRAMRVASLAAAAAFVRAVFSLPSRARILGERAALAPVFSLVRMRIELLS